MIYISKQEPESQIIETPCIYRKEDHGYDPAAWPADVPENRTLSGTSSAAHGVQHCPGCPLQRCGVYSNSQMHCESSCSQRWHRRITAALCMVGVTLSFVIIALGLLFGDSLSREPRSAWANLNGSVAAANASAPRTEHKTGSHTKDMPPLILKITLWSSTGRRGRWGGRPVLCLCSRWGNVAAWRRGGLLGNNLLSVSVDHPKPWSVRYGWPQICIVGRIGNTALTGGGVAGPDIVHGLEVVSIHAVQLVW
ncbi:hypothetical protein MRX96_045101 [Rhipicephalus microplus]